MEDHFCPNHKNVWVTSGKRYCDVCREKRSQDQAKRLAKRKQSGCCVQCGIKLPDDWTKTRCPACLEDTFRKSKKYFNKRVSERICRDCGAKLPDGWTKTKCPACTEKLAKYQKQHREQKLANGCCIRCGEKLPEGWSKKYCSTCIEKRRKTNQRRVEELKSRGICICCGKNKTAEGKVRCPECLAKALTRTKARQEKIKNNLSDIQASKNEIYCPNHPNVLVRDGHKMCPSCREKARNKQREKRINNENSLEKACCLCGEHLPKDWKKKTCDSCIKKAQKRMSKIRAERQAQKVCRQCGSDFILPGKLYCEDCLVARRTREKGIKADKEARCEECHVNRSLLGFPFCRKCLAKLRLTAPERVLPFYSDELLDNFMGWLKGEW